MSKSELLVVLINYEDEVSYLSFFFLSASLSSIIEICVSLKELEVLLTSLMNFESPS